jgi:hypothetical protein
MTHAIDIVHELVNRLSSSRAVMFQRDGIFHIVSGEAIGQIQPGLRTASGPHEANDAPEILASENLIEKYDKGYRVIARYAPERLKPIVFDEDTTTYSIAEIVASAEALAKLPDDGKICMIRHGDQYHGHKYGYAADGTDVWLAEARAIERTKYFELMRAEEDALRKEAEHYAARQDAMSPSASWYHSDQEPPRLPRGVVITPHLIVSFPRGGHLNPTSSCGPEMRFNSYECIVEQDEPNHYTESPHAAMVTIRTRVINAHRAQDFEAAQQTLMAKLSDELKAVAATMPSLQEHVWETNDFHNRIYAKDISRHKDLTKAQT